MVITQDDALLLLSDALRELKPSTSDRHVHLTTNLFSGGEAAVDSLGLDSLDAIELLSILEAKCKRRISPEFNMESLQTVGDVVDLIVVTTTTAA